MTYNNTLRASLTLSAILLAISSFNANASNKRSAQEAFASQETGEGLTYPRVTSPPHVMPITPIPTESLSITIPRGPAPSASSAAPSIATVITGPEEKPTTGATPRKHRYLRLMDLRKQLKETTTLQNIASQLTDWEDMKRRFRALNAEDYTKGFYVEICAKEYVKAAQTWKTLDEMLTTPKDANFFLQGIACYLKTGNPQESLNIVRELIRHNQIQIAPQPLTQQSVARPVFNERELEGLLKILMDYYNQEHEGVLKKDLDLTSYILCTIQKIAYFLKEEPIAQSATRILEKLRAFQEKYKPSPSELPLVLRESAPVVSADVNVNGSPQIIAATKGDQPPTNEHTVHPTTMSDIEFQDYLNAIGWGDEEVDQYLWEKYHGDRYSFPDFY